MASPISRPHVYPAIRTRTRTNAVRTERSLPEVEQNRAIPIYAPDLSGHERDYVLECLNTTWISSKGSFIGRFEKDFANYIDAPFATSVCNGTVALHLALLALGIGAGDEVIVPTLTYIATANAVTYTGAKPVFVDSVTGTWQLDPADVVRKITTRTRAVIAVHLYGHPADMDALAAICEQFNLDLVEDCAEAIGTSYKGRHVGTFGKISAFSFFGNKTMTTGEGGMVVTTRADLHERVGHLRGQGLSKNREYWHDIIGYNYRMTNICAAIGVAQLERIDKTTFRKRALAALYVSLLQGLPLSFQDKAHDVINSHWMVSILTDGRDDRDPLRQHLGQAGIETRPLFPPIHLMPMYGHGAETHAVAENVSSRGLNLPSWPGLSLADVSYVCDRVREYFTIRSPLN